jgi:hypothetical protein
VTGNHEHEVDHAAIMTALEAWEFDPEQREDILRDVLILHLGAFHRWTVTSRGEVLGLAPMLVRHDQEHGSRDALGVERFLNPVLIDGIRQTENELS